MNFLALFLVIAQGRALTEASGANSVNRWASTGGGWRAMAADMAFANVFVQAGLFTDDASEFSAVSTESGGTWFSTQFFYSKAFHSNVTESTPQELSAFVYQWMESYLIFTEGLAENPAECDFLDEFSNFTMLQVLSDYCNVFADFGGDWAAFINSMLEAASTGYGDPALVNRTLNAKNIASQSLAQTDLYLQMSLVPNARVRESGTGVYLGPSGEKDGKVYSLPTCVQYSVANNQTYFYSHMGDFNYTVVNGNISDHFCYPLGYENYGLFPAESQNVLIDSPIISHDAGSMNLPFNSRPNVAQVAAASSAELGGLSPLAPSTLSQAMSVERESLLEANKTLELALFYEKVDGIYDKTILDELSVCSAWPDDCGSNDGRFIDGFFTDAPTLAMNIGQYHSKRNGDLNQNMKAVVTLNTLCGRGQEFFLAYFNTTFNDNIEPGDFLWPQNETSTFHLPLQSPQIFDYNLTSTDLEQITSSIEGLNVTYAIIQGAETLENDAFQVKAGQTVDVLALMLNSCIPPDIIGTTLIQANMQPLADLAKEISANQELVEVVRNFFFDQ